jgi:predicted transcriptional regulator
MRTHFTRVILFRGQPYYIDSAVGIMEGKGKQRALAIITFVKNNSGANYCQILEGLKDADENLVMEETVSKLVKEGFLKLVKAKGKGESNSYYITDKGLTRARCVN